MKVNELMVGDWVKVTTINQPRKISGTNDMLFHDDYEPIPLTEDILVKNGFEKNHNDEAPVEECYFYRLFAKPCGWFDIDAFGLEEELGAEFTYHDVNINYVHQLQHLMRLCGIEKEIEL